MCAAPKTNSVATHCTFLWGQQSLGLCCLTIAALQLPQTVFSMQKQWRLLTDSFFSPWQITRFQSNCYWRCYQQAEAASEPSAA